MRLPSGSRLGIKERRAPITDAEIVAQRQQRLRQAMDESSLLIPFLAKSGRAVPAEAITKVVAVQHAYAANPVLNDADEAAFWLAFGALINAASPATVEGIRHVALYRSVSFFGWIWRNVWITLTTSVVVLIYLLVQIHVVSGTTIVNHYTATLDDLATASRAEPVDSAKVDLLAKDAGRLGDLVTLWNACPVYPILIPCFTGVSTSAPDQALRAQISLNEVNTYFLPLILALLGSCTQVLRSIARRISEQSLNTSFLPTYYVRVLLGLIIGATIGLFLAPASASNPANPLGFLATLPLLTAAFLAGYGVEIFFALLDKLVNDARDYIKGKKSDDGAGGTK
jgi:hypothetical protein